MHLSLSTGTSGLALRSPEFASRFTSTHRAPATRVPLELDQRPHLGIIKVAPLASLTILNSR